MHSEPPGDLSFEDYGSVWLIDPITEDGRLFLEKHAPDDAQWIAGKLAVEQRFVGGWWNTAWQAFLDCSRSNNYDG